MTDRGERSSEVADRLGRRFDTDEPEEPENTDEQNEQPSDHSDNGENEQQSQHSDRSDDSDRSDNSDRSESSERSDRSDNSDDQDDAEHSDRSANSDNSVNSDRVRNVKQEWNGSYIYLPDELDAPFDAEFDRLVYECGQGLGWKPKKNRHYYPVVIMYGIDAVTEMDAETFKEHVEALDLV